MSAVRAGDDRAFEQLYARYEPRMTLYTRGLVHDHGRAEDVTQEVFFSALRRIRATDTEINFKPWLYEIAKNACIDQFRRSRHTTEVSFDADDETSADAHSRHADGRATPDTAIDTKLALDNLCGAFGGLSETHHQILVMRELEGLSYRDIGEQLSMSRPAVESTLFRARRRLEEEYDELASGKRCLRVRGIVDAGGRAAGVRAQRRMDRHISHCQSCRRYALTAGVDLQTRPARPAVAARIAAFLPLPAMWRRAGTEETPAQVLGSGGQATAAHWSANVMSTVDPATIWGWGKAVAAAATVAAAGVGAGAAITKPQATRDFFSRAPAMVGIGGSSDRARDKGGASGPAGGTSSTRKAGGERPGGHPAGGQGTTKNPGGSAARRSNPAGTARPVQGRDAKPHSPGSGRAAGRGGGGGGGGGLLDETLGRGSGAGGQSGGTGSGSGGGAPIVTDTVNGVMGTLGNALPAAAGAAGVPGLVQNPIKPVATTVGTTLSGN